MDPCWCAATVTVVRSIAPAAALRRREASISATRHGATSAAVAGASSQACRANPALAGAPGSGDEAGDDASAVGDASGLPIGSLGCCTGGCPITDARRCRASHPAMQVAHRQQHVHASHAGLWRPCAEAHDVAHPHAHHCSIGMALPVVLHRVRHFIDVATCAGLTQRASPSTPTVGARSMLEPTAPTVLVELGGVSPSLMATRHRACPAAIHLPAVAVRTQQHLIAAACAQEQAR